MLNFSGLNDITSVLSGLKATNTGGSIQLFETAHKGGAKRKSRKSGGRKRTVKKRANKRKTARRHRR
jgi:hypothetical protein